MLVLIVTLRATATFGHVNSTLAKNAHLRVATRHKRVLATSTFHKWQDDCPSKPFSMHLAQMSLTEWCDESSMLFIEACPDACHKREREAFVRDCVGGNPRVDTPARVCVGILAHQGVKTLENTLASYTRVGIFDIASEAHILFQQIDSPERRAWAEDVVSRYPPLRPLYEKDNVGFGSYLTFLAACGASEMVLLLEEDFQVSETMTRHQVRQQFQNAVWLLEHGVDAVRLRSRKDPGHPNYSYETWKRKGKIESTHLLSHVFWDDHAEDHVPQIRVCRKEPKTWCASSTHAHYTNNPTMYRREFAEALYAHVPPSERVFSKMEPWLTRYWSKQDFQVAYSDAIFTHNRLDRTLGRMEADKGSTKGAKPTSNTVVLAAALNYGIGEFVKFIVPLRRVYSGDVVLFVSNSVDDDVAALCAKHEVETRGLPTGSRLGVKGDRFEGYTKVCEAYDWCFATDFRDVFFQADPFASTPDGYDLVLQEEFASLTIKTCPYNSNWIKTCWGTAFLDSIGTKTPICSGTIMGTPRGLEALKKAMFLEMEHTKRVKGCTARDQGHLNYIYHAGKLPVPVLVQPRGRGIVNTVGSITPRDTIGEYLNDEGRVKNDDGSISAVVHQYDRFPLLKSLLSDFIRPRARRRGPGPRAEIRRPGLGDLGSKNSSV